MISYRRSSFTSIWKASCGSARSLICSEKRKKTAQSKLQSLFAPQNYFQRFRKNDGSIFWKLGEHGRAAQPRRDRRRRQRSIAAAFSRALQILYGSDSRTQRRHLPRDVRVHRGRVPTTSWVRRIAILSDAARQFEAWTSFQVQVDAQAIFCQSRVGKTFRGGGLFSPVIGLY